MPRSRFHPILALVLLLAVAFSGPACAQESKAPTREQPAKDPGLLLEDLRERLKWDVPAEPFRIVGPLYSVGTKGLGVFLLATTDGLILLNTGMPGSGPTTEAAIRKLGFDPQDLKILLTGHAHLDHCGALAHFRKLAPGARIAMIEEERELFESGGRTDFEYGQHQAWRFEGVKVDRVLRDGDVITLGEVKITALLTGGHTRGATTFVTRVADGGKTWTVVFPNGLGINPGYRVEVDPSYPGIADDYRRTLTVLEGLQPDIWLMPHPEFHDQSTKLARAKTEGVKAWIDPAGYRRYLRVQRENLDKVRARERAAAGQR